MQKAINVDFISKMCLTGVSWCPTSHDLHLCWSKPTYVIPISLIPVFIVQSTNTKPKEDKKI